MIESLEKRLMLSTNVLSFHGDLTDNGLNATENQLTPANVAVGSFGKLFTTPVDGQVYAEPLVITNITINAGPNTRAGAAGLHSSIVLVATEHDSLYAIDGSVAGGAILWQRTFLDPTVAANNTLGATAITTVPNADVGSTDINPEIGITGTPVIDASTNIAYVVVTTKETINGVANYVQRLHAINLSDGTDATTPFLIAATNNGNTNTTPIYVYGTGDGAVTDPYNNTGQQVVQFNALREAQRAGLTLVNGQIYVAWASHGDQGPYHGWVVSWNISNIKTTGFQLSGVLNATPNGGLGGIWQGAGKLAFEPDGSAFYFVTGNGPSVHPNPTINAAGFPSDADYYESLVKVVADPTTSPTNQNPNGWGMKVADYFIPYNQVALDNADRDFGSGGVLVLPPSAGIPGHPNLLVVSGKEGKIYLIDRNNLGKYNPTGDNVLNAVPNGSGNNTPPVQIGGSLSTPAYYNGLIYWTGGYSSSAEALQINPNGTLSIVSQTTDNFGYLPGSAVVSSNGTTGGIVWVMDRNTNEIHAYDASTFATELWNSGEKAGGADSVGAVVKFATPTVANGEVYVGTTSSLVVFGLTPPANATPAAPLLSAVALSASSINLKWADYTVAPNLASGYAIEESTDGVNFSQITTAPPGSTSIAIGGLNALTTYYFRMRGYNGLGSGAYSNVASAQTSNAVALLDYSQGFAAAASSMTLNGFTHLNGSLLQLTNGNGFENSSAFSNSAVDVTKFTTQFQFQIGAGVNTADGFTFCIQGVGPTALGGSGGGLGYGTDGVNGGPTINNSVAIKFDLYSNAGEGPDSTGLYLNGNNPTNLNSIDLSSTGINLHSGDTFQVNMTYDGATLTVTILDTVTQATATQTYSVNIPSIVGGGTAYVGFTAGTGGVVATQSILSWTFSPNAQQAPNAPSALGGSPANATTINLSWTNNATNQTGYHLDRATDPNFVDNLITQTLPASATTFTDTYTGLAPGQTFYYRLRAFNTAGDSANSNSVAVAIPLAPAKPSNALVANVTTSEIDLTWTDNAGTTAASYLILRSVNGGTFTQYASLPALTAPGTYTWSDLNLTPGTAYEYHIEAINSSGNNDFVGANAVTLTTPPTALTATATTTAVNLSWAAPLGAVQFNVFRGTAPGAESTTPLAVVTTGTTYSDTTAVPGVTYYYTVAAVNGNISHVPVIPSQSAISNEASATIASATIAPVPMNLVASAAAINTGIAQVNLTWSASAGAASYRIYRSTTSNTEGGVPLATGVTGTSFTDLTAVFGTTYFYKVTAVDAAGESGLSVQASAIPLLQAHINFTAAGGLAVPNYLQDVGLAYGSRINSLTFGWNQDNTANMRDRLASNAPNELQDSLGHMQKPGNPNAWWGIAVPNGTYTVHLTSGDPTADDSSYQINVGGTLNTTTNLVTGGILALSGNPTPANLWFQNTVTVTVTNGVLYVSNAATGNNNKIDEIDITQISAAQQTIPPVLPSTNFSSGFAAATSALQLNGGAIIKGTNLQLTSGNYNQASSAFTNTKFSVSKFTTSFDFQISPINNGGDGLTFTIQGVAPTAVGSLGGGLGYGLNGTTGASIAKSVAIKFDAFNNQGEGNNSTGLYTNGAAPMNVGSIDLTSSTINFKSGDPFNVAMSYDGTTLTVTITDKTTHATATQSYAINIAATVGSNMAYLGFTSGTGVFVSVNNVLDWVYTPM